MSDDIEDVLAQLRALIQQRETDAFRHGKTDTSGEVYRQGFRDGEKGLRDRLLRELTAVAEPKIEDRAEFLPRSLTAEDRAHIVGDPDPEVDTKALRQALAECAAEPELAAEVDIVQCESCDAALPIDDMTSVADSAYYCPACVARWNNNSDASPKPDELGAPAAQEKTEAQSDDLASEAYVSAQDSAADPEPAGGAYHGLTRGAEIIQRADRLVDMVEPATQPPPGMASLGTLADVLKSADRPMGERAAEIPPIYWTEERNELLRGLIAGRRTEEELLAAFPEKAITAIGSRCYALKIDPPTKSNFKRWALERGRVNTADTGKVGLDDVINSLRITGDVVLTLDDPLCEMFQINGTKCGRAHLLATANKYRRRAGKPEWDAKQVVWKRRQLPASPPGNPAKVVARQAAK